jgi:hypothetical protein
VKTEGLCEALGSVVLGLKEESGGVYAVAKTCRFWTVIEEVAKMGMTACTKDFRAFHEEGIVFPLKDILVLKGLVKTRPSCAGVEFVGTFEKGGLTTNAKVIAFFFMIPVSILEGFFGSCLPCDAVLFWCETFFPCAVFFCDERGRE